MDKSALFKGMSSCLEKILQNPVIYFNEGDIQGLFYEHLKKIPVLSKMYPTDVSIGKNQFGSISKIKYKTHLIHREFGLNKHKHQRIDLGIFNETEIKRIHDPIYFKDKENKYIVPDYIFEFGTEKSAGTTELFEKHIKNDLNKLKNSRVCGFLIHIQRNNTSKRIIEKNKLRWIDLKNSLNQLIKIIPPNVIPLIFRIDIGHETRRIPNKLKFYLNNTFKPVSVDVIKQEVLNYLLSKDA